MSATITGIVFADIKHTGRYPTDAPGLENVCIGLKTPDQKFLTTSTNSSGQFTFTTLYSPGKYILYELGNMSLSLDTPPETCPLLFGYTSVTTPRLYRFTLSLDEIHNHSVLEPFYFGYDYLEAFSPTDEAFQVSPSLGNLMTLNLITGKSHMHSTLSEVGHYFSIAYHPTSHYLYGYDTVRHQVFRIGANGAVTFYTIPNLPQKNYTACSINAEGLLYLYASGDLDIYILQTHMDAINFMHIVCPSTKFSLEDENYSLLTPALSIKAWAFHPQNHYLYSISEDGCILKVHPLEGTSETFITTGTPLTACSSLFFDYNGFLYCLFEQSTILYRITLNSGEALAEVFSCLKQPLLLGGARYSDMPLLVQLGTAPDYSALNSKGNYSTTLANNGPRHAVTHTLSFGEVDGLVPTPLQINDRTYTIELPILNYTGKEAFLYGWIDFNQNGIFELKEACEPLTICSKNLDLERVQLNFVIPSKQPISVGETYCRFRLTTDKLNLDTSSIADSRSLGAASDGQVLDLPLMITGLPPSGTTHIYEVCLLNESLSGSCALTDPCHGILSYTIVKLPSQGNLKLDSKSGKWHYIPKHDYKGEDAFILRGTSSTSSLYQDIHVVIHTIVAELSLNYSVNLNEMNPDDLLIYKLILTNSGTVPLINITLQHLIPFGGYFIARSGTLNGLHNPALDLEKHFVIEELLPSSTYSLSFQCGLSSQLDKLMASFTASYHYMAHPDIPLVSCTEESMTLVTDVKYPKLILTIETDTSDVLATDHVTFKLLLTNDGNITLDNIRIYPRLHEALIYQDDLAINCEPAYTPFLRGYTLKQLPPGTSTLLIFSVVVKDIPDSISLESFFKVEYTYTISGKNYSKAENSHHHTLKAHVPHFTFTKIPSKTNVSLNELFTYIYTLQNDSNFPIYDVCIQDSLPSFLEILEIDSPQHLLPNTLSTGVVIPKVPAHQTVAIHVHLKAISRPHTTNWIPHCKATFNVQLPGATGYRNQSISPSHAKDIFVSDAVLVAHCELSSTQATLGETITYTLKLMNTGTVVLTEVIIQDLLSPELKFIPHSVSLNKKPLQDASIITGISLQNLEVNSCTILTFQVLIISKVSKEVDCSLSLHYTYTGSTPSTLKTNHVRTNSPKLILHYVGIEISGHVSKQIAFLNDKVDYTLTVENTGDTPVFNTILKNTSPSYDIVDSSFNLNQQPIHSVDLLNGINLGTLAAGKSFHIHYTEQISNKYYPLDTLTHIFSATYAYSTYDSNIKYGTSNTFTLSLPLALSTFKQFDLERYFELSDHKPDFETIHSISGDITVLKHTLIPGPTATSYEGQKLTSHTLVFHGILELTTEYSTLESSHSVYSSQHTSYFSTSIALPESFPKHSKIRIHPTLQVVAFKLINNRSFFASASILAVAYIK